MVESVVLILRTGHIWDLNVHGRVCHRASNFRVSVQYTIDVSRN